MTAPTKSVGHVLVAAQFALHMTQSQLGTALGASGRSASRWACDEATPSRHNLIELAKLLVPVDLALATDAAAHAGETLESLGLVAPAVVAPPPSPAPAAPPPKAEDLIENVLCAVADFADVAPKTMRPLLYAAFKRASEVGLTVEAATRALAPAPPVPAAPRAKEAKTGSARAAR